ncbi:MAG: intradiol ring-cleavage dioxygenase [Betaproteobacteria bacterium]|nr:intradiol ring-cleavage dioxygenase [Betaproteobacteria bacterium]
MPARIARRKWLIASASLFGLAMLYPGRRAFGAELLPTPRQTEGPFYPLVRPKAIDNDLIHVPGQTGVAAGEITTVTGRVLDTAGRPFAGVLVEIWQVNGYGRYHDTRDSSTQPLDPRFKGYGTCLTDDDGGYRFLTIKPVAYPGRTPHIHFAVSGSGVPRFVTQMYIAGAAENERQMVLRGLSATERARLAVSLEKAANGESRAVFDIVLERRSA